MADKRSTEGDPANGEAGRPNGEPGTDGYPADTARYPADTAGYPEREEEGQEAGEGDPEPGEEGPESEEGDPEREEDGMTSELSEEFVDLERFLEPREVARKGLLMADQPIAHDGKAGWAVERKTGRAVWISGETQWDVMARSPYAKRDEPGLTDVPSHGGLPSNGDLSGAAQHGEWGEEHGPAEEHEPAKGVSRSVAREYEARRKARRVQLNLKLRRDEAAVVEEAAFLFGVSRTTLARMLVVRGAREIAGKAPGDSSE